MGLVVVTAADRAAATVRDVGDEPLRPPMAGTSPFRGGFAGIAAKGTSPTHPKHEKSDGIHHRIFSCAPPRRTSAAALSAAVDSRKQQGIRAHAQAEPPMQEQPRQTPAALREGARGRGFSQRSRLPRNPHRPPTSLREGVRGRRFSVREAASPEFSYSFNASCSVCMFWRITDS